MYKNSVQIGNISQDYTLNILSINFGIFLTKV